MDRPANQEENKRPPKPNDPGLLAALTGTDAARERAVSLRTRRAVYKALVTRRADRQDGRRNLLVALAMAGALALALAPALWAGVDDLLGGETLLDLPGMLVLLGVTLCAAVAAVLFLLGDDRRAALPARGQVRGQSRGQSGSQGR